MYDVLIPGLQYQGVVFVEIWVNRTMFGAQHGPALAGSEEAACFPRCAPSLLRWCLWTLRAVQCWWLLAQSPPHGQPFERRIVPVSPADAVLPALFKALQFSEAHTTVLLQFRETEPPCSCHAASKVFEQHIFC
jgi:hypothetical protein